MEGGSERLGNETVKEQEEKVWDGGGKRKEKKEKKLTKC